MNNCVFIGRLAKDVELRTTTNGKTVGTFCIAVSKGKDKGADFINCVAWEHTAVFVSRYFQKGSMIGLQGQLHSRQYEDKNGAKRTAYEVTVQEVSFCGKKEESDFEEIDDDLPFGD